MIDVDIKDVKRYERDLKTFAHRAFPFATKETVNRSAFQSQKFVKKDLKSRFILRNQFTLQSIQIDQAKTLNVSRQVALMGSTADYMEDQEFGGTRIKKGRKGIPIATSYAAGQGLSRNPRTRLPIKANKLKNIILKRRKRQSGSRKLRNLIAIKQAASSGNKHLFLDLGKKKGIFEVVGGEREAKLRMVWDLTEQNVTIRKQPSIKPAVDRTIPLILGFYKESLIFQLRRFNLFRD